jgi:hypothetical protein
MAWSMSGTYVAICNCHGVCPCPVASAPSSESGECTGVAAFHVERGEADGVDLSGVNWALYNYWPTTLTEGNWKVAVVIDEGASDEQAAAIDRIVQGKAGGPFGELSALYGEWLGTERRQVTFNDGDRPTASIGEQSELSFEPLLGADGAPTTVRNAAYGFAPEYKIGKGAGRSDAFGMTFDGDYGESAQFEFASEMPEGAPAGRA